MKNAVIRIMVSSLLALVLINLTVNPASAGGSQDWYLTDIPAGLHADDLTSHVCDNIMRKLESTVVNPIEFVGGPSTAWWYSENKAESDVAFGENNWRLELNLSAFGSGNLHAQVWSVDESGHMERLLAKGTKQINTVLADFTMDCDDYGLTEQTVLKDHRIALRLSFEGIGWVNLFYCPGCFGPGILHSPETDPGFPLPELPAIVLLAGGLGCLAGYVVLRRWRCAAHSSDVTRVKVDRPE